MLFCGTRLAGIVATVAAGKLAAQIDWQTFYAAGAAALAAATLLFLAGLRTLAPSLSHNPRNAHGNT